MIFGRCKEQVKQLLLTNKANTHTVHAWLLKPSLLIFRPTPDLPLPGGVLASLFPA
jgi:hypothetical protein